MNAITFGIIAFLISGASFVYGAIRLFRRKIPMYFQLLICAAGCLAINQLSLVVNLWCEVQEMFSINILGVFGSAFFLFSANYGTLDKIVDDGGPVRGARGLAWIAPAVMTMLTAAAFMAWKNTDLLYSLAWAFVLLPSLPASYFNLKHLLLPPDDFGFLKATAPCNLMALAFYAVTAAFVACSAFTETLAGAVATAALLIMISLVMLALTLCAVKGAEKWKI